MNRGDVCLAHFPFTDATGAKLRPVLVVSRNDLNRGDDLVVLPISSAPDPSDPHAINVDDPMYRAAGLRCPSSVKWSKPATIAESVIERRLGTMQKVLLDQICEKLQSVFQPTA